MLIGSLVQSIIRGGSDWVRQGIHGRFIRHGSRRQNWQTGTRFQQQLRTWSFFYWSKKQWLILRQTSAFQRSKSMRVTVRHSRQKPAVRGKSKLAVCWKLPHTYTHTMKTACQPPEIKWCGWLIKNVKSKISIAVYISGFLPGVSTWGINIGL